MITPIKKEEIMEPLRKFILGVSLLAVTACCGCGMRSNFAGATGYSTLVFTATKSTTLSAPIGAMEVELTLPSGVSIATEGASGQITAGTLLPGSTLSGASVTSGTYNSSTGKAHLTLVTSGDSFQGGEFARLTCTIAKNSGVSKSALATKSTATLVQAVGYDSTTKSTVALTSQLNVTLAAN